MRSLLLASSYSSYSSRSSAPSPSSRSPPTPSRSHVPKGTMLKDTYTAKEGSVFPGTQREYQIYLPAGHRQNQPAAFMVFQDGVIYQAPVVFDNLIAKKDIPPLVGIFIKPGVVPAANDNALPRFNRSYEYDSITPTYSQFLIDEFLPAIEAKHGLKLSTDPNHAAISGNSSGGICAFMVAWHRPDRFRRVFTGVGTYVGIHGADQLPVLVRKFEPKPLRVFLQSGTGDNNLYCGDWWMANQMMERSLTWAGYDVNHAWGEGGHNAKHASQIFPDVMSWLWRDWQTDIEVKANPKGESKWKGYEVVGDGEWRPLKNSRQVQQLCATVTGGVYCLVGNVEGDLNPKLAFISPDDDVKVITDAPSFTARLEAGSNASLICVTMNGLARLSGEGRLIEQTNALKSLDRVSMRHDGSAIAIQDGKFTLITNEMVGLTALEPYGHGVRSNIWAMTFSPDQTHLYVGGPSSVIDLITVTADGHLSNPQPFYLLDNLGSSDVTARDLCVDTNGWLYVATSLGIQVCDQAGRVNFIIPTPKQPYDVCFGGKDLSELFIACGDTIYKRPTKAKGVVSGQQPPIKPAPPKL
jgi:gluconolactonase